MAPRCQGRSDATPGGCAAFGHAWTVFHLLAIPGSRANADHLVIGPSGVFLADAKHYRGRLTLTPKAPCGTATTGCRLTLRLEDGA